MKLKPTILDALTRENLKRIVDDLGIDGVDRRSADGMRAALRRARRAKPETLLAHMRKDQIKEVCEVMGVSPKGKKDELIERLVNGQGTRPQQQGRHSVGKEQQTELDFNGEVKQAAARQKKVEKLTLARLERKLFEACDILRGNMDASEYKEYIFGMLFLKRMSDQFEKDQTALRAQYEQKNLQPTLIEKQLANPDKYDFYVCA